MHARKLNYIKCIWVDQRTPTEVGLTTPDSSIGSINQSVWMLRWAACALHFASILWKQPVAPSKAFLERLLPRWLASL